MPNKISLNIDRASYTEGEYVKIKLDYEMITPKITMHLVIFDPSEREVFSEDQYVSSQKGLTLMFCGLIQNNGKFQEDTRLLPGTKKELERKSFFNSR